MTATPALIVASVVLPTPTVAAAFTVDVAGKGYYLDNVSFLNFGTVADTVTVNITQGATAVGNANLRLKAVSIAAGTSYMPPELQGKYMAPNSVLEWASGAGNINGEITGRILTA